MRITQHPSGMYQAETEDFIVSDVTREGAVRKLNFLIEGQRNWDLMTEEEQDLWLKKWKRRDGETWQK